MSMPWFLTEELSGMLEFLVRIHVLLYHGEAPYFGCNHPYSSLDQAAPSPPVSLRQDLA
jgi:hypothetical protein